MDDCRTLLAAVDFSPFSGAVLRTAGRLRAALGAELVVLNVLNQRDLDAVETVQRLYPAVDVERFLAKSKAERLEGLARLAAEQGLDPARIRRIVRVGVPHREILLAVEEEQADLLVMGVHGRGQIAEALFGSTAEKVFRRSPVPVLSVRPGRPAGAPRG